MTNIVSVTVAYPEPSVLYIVSNNLPIDDAKAAFKEAECKVQESDIQPITGGYHAIVGKTRYLFQGAIKESGIVRGQYAPAHVHDDEEVSEIKFGGVHVWTWPDWDLKTPAANVDKVAQYAFYKKGDTMKIPPHIPHCVVVAGYENQCGVLMVRSSKPNPQLFPSTLPQLPSLEKAIKAEKS